MPTCVGFGTAFGLSVRRKWISATPVLCRNGFRQKRPLVPLKEEKENAGEIHGRESETDGDIDISTAAFDMEGVVWGAEEAEESKEDSKKDSKTDREE